MKLTRCAIGLGGNLGDRFENLVAARRELARVVPSGGIFEVSRIYESAPQDCPPGSPHFLNAAALMDHPGPALELLAALQEIENQLGRNRSGVRNEARIIDLDLLFFGEEKWDHPELILPHPRLDLRPFVLKPLGELIENLPGDQRGIEELLSALDFPAQAAEVSDIQWPDFFQSTQLR